MAYGLLKVIPGSELAQKDDIAPEELTEMNVSELARHIRKQWEVNKSAKIFLEEGLLEDQRAKKGQYSPEKLRAIQQMGGSSIYMMLTATKQRAAASWIKDIILPPDEKAWGIDPTPIPQLPDWAEKAVRERMVMLGEEANSQAEQDLRQMVADELSKQAKYSAENMENKIEDQLAEAKWGMIMDELIDDFTTFSCCIMKGPVLKKRKTLKWVSTYGDVKPKVGEEIMLSFDRVSPFDIYPSPEASDVNDGNLIERIRFRRGELWAMRGVPGYKDSEIEAVLDAYPLGLRDWLWNDTERLENENKHRWWMNSENGLIDGLHFWGSVQGTSLQTWGIEVPEPLAEYQIDAILIGNYVIRCQINNDPLARRPYHKACYDPLPGAFFGNSIRYLMNDIQEFCNASARSLVNNMAMASGPQVEINYERLDPMERELEIHPWKIWQTRGSEVGGSNAVNFFQPESNAAELVAVYEKFEQKADDATMIPRYSYGNEKTGGAGTTASGLSMLMQSAAKGIKQAIGNLDNGIVRPAIEMVYYYNMLTSKDPSIKGDAKIVAKGANALLLRDMAQTRRSEFLQMTTNEIDMNIVGPEGRAKLLRGIANDLDLKGIVPSEQILKERLEAQAANQPPDPAVLKIEADSQESQARIEADVGKAQMEIEDKSKGRELELVKIERQAEQKREEQERKHRYEMEKIQKEEDAKIRVMHEETARIVERAEINSEKELEKHTLEMEQKDQHHRELLAQKRADAEKTAASETKEPEGSVEKEQPMILNITVDNKSGTVKKKISIDRGADKLMKDLTVTETEA